MRKDAIGIPLSIGDIVVFSESPSMLTEAVVIDFTPKKIRVETLGRFSDQTTKFPEQLVSVMGSYEMHPELLL